MRTHALLLSLVLAACGGETPAEPPAEPPADPPAEPPADPPPDPVPVDDDNRFVQEDLDRFMADHPDVLREEDEARYRTCVGEACRVEPGAGVNPFAGAGIRYLVPLWLRGCLSGDGRSCLYAGRTYQSEGLGGEQEPAHGHLARDEARAKFRAYIARACDLDAMECTQWADYRLGDDDPPEADVARAIARLTASCEAEDHHACAALARHSAGYPQIGEARGWWRRACDADETVPSEPCARYAEGLFATGARADRDAAAEALGQNCDPEALHWRRSCQGEREAGTEACTGAFLWKHGAACAGFAGTRPDEEALVLHAALCNGSLIDEANAVGARSCATAQRLARRLGRTEGYRDALRRRACEPAYYECLSDAMDLEGCGDARDVCRAGS